jgi:superoxide dismutase, Cu-Zn family
MKTRNELKLAGLCVAIALGVGGCGSDKTSIQSSGYSTADSTRGRAGAIARLSPTGGNTARGDVFFSKETEGVRVEGEIIGLTPGKHGFHIHDKGDCSAPDASSAGGHYNPTGMPHGGPRDGMRHVGDLGNITANQSGTARFAYTDNRISLEGKHSIIGHSVVVDAGADDLQSQPSGNAGARVACGVVQKK